MSVDKYVLENASYGSDILVMLNSQRSEGSFTDAVLSVEHEEFPCHRNVLAASSPYFKAMFTCNLSEGRGTCASFNDVSPWTLKRIIDYVYTGRIEITPENAQELLAAGSLFEYPAIVDACCEFLKRQLHQSNCLGIEHFAQLHSCIKLQEEARNYVLENFTAVTGYDEFLDLSFDRLSSFISSDFIDVRSEEIVYDAVIRWVKFDLEERQSFLSQLLEDIRLPVIDINYLNVVKQDPLISGCKECLSLVLEAELHHESVHDQHGKRRRSMQTISVHPRPSTVAKEVIVVVGGLNSYVTKTVEMFDSRKGKWFPLPDFPKSVSWYSVSVLLNSIFVVGGILDGHIIANVWKFSSAKRAWTEVKSMLKQRASHSSGTIDDRLYVIGGVTYDSSYSVVDADTIECYDPTLETWTKVGKSAFPRKESQIVTINNRLVQVGGLQGGVMVNTMETYVCSEETDTETKIHSTGEQFILPEAIQFAQVVVLNRMFYIIWEETKKVIELNPEKRTFRRLPNLHFSHKHSGATVLAGKIFLTGGVVESKPSNIMECYDPETEEWTIEKSMEEARSCHGCVTVQL